MCCVHNIERTVRVAIFILIKNVFFVSCIIMHCVRVCDGGITKRARVVAVFWWWWWWCKWENKEHFFIIVELGERCCEYAVFKLQIRMVSVYVLMCFIVVVVLVLIVCVFVWEEASNEKL